MTDRKDLPDVEFPVRVRYFFDGWYDHVVPLAEDDEWRHDVVIPDGVYWLIPASETP